MKNTIWKQHPTLKSYDVSDCGWVRRGFGCAKKGNTIPGRILKSKVQPNGYIAVSVCEDGVESTHLVHRLVAETFLSNGDGKCVNHKNGKKDDNRIENLEWVTSAENYAHAIREGLAPVGVRNGSVTQPHRRPRGERNTQAKLTGTQVLEIRKVRSQGMSLSQIAKSYGVCVQSIHNIVTNKTWAHA